LVGFSFELTDIEWDASSFDVTWATADNWGVDWSSAIWTRLKWWLFGADAFDGILATTANVGVRDSLSDFTVSAWKVIRNWAVFGITDTFVVITASWSSWVVSFDQHWFTASIRTSSLSWNWTRINVTNTFFFVDSGATSAWSFNMNFGSGDHSKTGWASSFLIINWTQRTLTFTNMLWTTFTFRSGQNSAWSVANWSGWAKFWFVNANMIITATHVFVTVDINSNWNFLNEASEFNGTVFNDWSSAVVWVTNTLELWATVGFGGAFFTVSPRRGNNNSNFFTGNTVSFFVIFSGFSASGGITQASLAATA
jgi:hypothetical protein